MRNLALASRGIESQLRVLDDLGKKFNLDIVVVDSLAYDMDGVVLNSALNGAYDPNTGRVFVALDAQEGALMYVGMHEIAHALKATNEAAYNELDKFVAEYLNGTDKTMESLIKGQQERFGYTPEEAREEVISNTLPAILADEKMVYKIAGTKFGRRLYNKLTGFQKSLNDTVARLSKLDDWQQIDILKNDIETINKMVEMFEKGMAEKTQNREIENKIKKLINPTFAADYKAWDGADPRVRFELGTSSRKLQYIGIKPKSIYMKASDVIHAKQHDEMTDDKIMQIPLLLEDPRIIMESKTINGRVVLMGDVYSTDENGRLIPIVAIIELVKDAHQNYGIKEYLLVKNAYAKDTNPQHLLDSSRILYVEEDIKKAQMFFERTGLQLPVGSKYGLNNRISFSKKYSQANSEKSLTKTDSLGNNLSAEQQEYFKDSKVRDAEGRLRVVWHGSGSDFNVFSHDFISMHGSMEGQGFYFTDKKSMAEGYQKKGGKLFEGYLDIKKPLSDSSLTLTRAEVTRLLKAVDPTGDDVVINYDPQGGMGYPSKAWYDRALGATVDSLMNYNETDSELLADLANSGAGPENVLKTVRKELGYDGYIVDNKYDNATVYVAFESNQFKNADNTTPTTNPDTRFSLKTDKGAADRAWYAENAKPINVAIKSNDGVKVGKMSYPEEAQQKAKSAAKTQRQTVYEWAQNEDTRDMVHRAMAAKKKMSGIARAYAKSNDLTEKKAKELLDQIAEGKVEAKTITPADMKAYAEAKSVLDTLSEIGKANKEAYRNTAKAFLEGSEAWKDNRKAG